MEYHFEKSNNYSTAMKFQNVQIFLDNDTENIMGYKKLETVPD